MPVALYSPPLAISLSHSLSHTHTHIGLTMLLKVHFDSGLVTVWFCAQLQWFQMVSNRAIIIISNTHTHAHTHTQTHTTILHSSMEKRSKALTMTRSHMRVAHIHTVFHRLIHHHAQHACFSQYLALSLSFSFTLCVSRPLAAQV